MKSKVGLAAISSDALKVERNAKAFWYDHQITIFINATRWKCFVSDKVAVYGTSEGRGRRAHWLHRPRRDANRRSARSIKGLCIVHSARWTQDPRIVVHKAGAEKWAGAKAGTQPSLRRDRWRASLVWAIARAAERRHRELSGLVGMFWMLDTVVL